MLGGVSGTWDGVPVQSGVDGITTGGSGSWRWWGWWWYAGESGGRLHSTSGCTGKRSPALPRLVAQVLLRSAGLFVGAILFMRNFGDQMAI